MTDNNMIQLIDSVEIDRISESLQKINRLQAVVKKTLKKDHDYGSVGGVTKPTLLKPGAEKILILLGLTSEYEIIEKIEDWDRGVFGYTVKCTLSKGPIKVTEGLGSCNSLEDKYRYRWVYEKELPAGIDKDNLKQRNGKYRIDNDEPFSQVNTILKMAKKRAQVDATLTVASLSEVFTQDVEDMQEFQQREVTENMTLNDAMNMVVSFGKYKGQTVADIFNHDAGYLDWISKNARVEKVRKAAEIVLNQSPQQNEFPEFEEEDVQEDLPPFMRD